MSEGQQISGEWVGRSPVPQIAFFFVCVFHFCFCVGNIFPLW